MERCAVCGVVPDPGAQPRREDGRLVAVAGDALRQYALLARCVHRSLPGAPLLPRCTSSLASCSSRSVEAQLPWSTRTSDWLKFAPAPDSPLGSWTPALHQLQLHDLGKSECMSPVRSPSAHCFAKRSARMAAGWRCTGLASLGCLHSSTEHTRRHTCTPALCGIAKLGELADVQHLAGEHRFDGVQPPAAGIPTRRRPARSYMAPASRDTFVKDMGWQQSKVRRREMSAVLWLPRAAFNCSVRRQKRRKASCSRRGRHQGAVDSASGAYMCVCS